MPCANADRTIGMGSVIVGRPRPAATSMSAGCGRAGVSARIDGVHLSFVSGDHHWRSPPQARQRKSEARGGLGETAARMILLTARTMKPRRRSTSRHGCQEVWHDSGSHEAPSYPP